MDLWTEDDIKISVQLKNIKHIYLRIYPPGEEIRITAPQHTSLKEIEAFLQKKRQWIAEQREELRRKAVRQGAEEEKGVFLWGNPYSPEWVPGSAKKISLVADKIRIETKKEPTEEGKEKIFREWHREELKKALPSIFEKCCKQVGVEAKEWRIKDMTTKWGTCNIKEKRIWVNLQLVKKDPVCLEYVVTHELVHLLERNHTPRFYEILHRCYPDWKKAEKLLEM